MSLSHNQIHQYSLINALMQGICVEGLPASQLPEKGDHGLGTLSGLNGEIVIIDGVCYHFTASGGAHILGDQEIIAFIMITRFQPVNIVQLPHLSFESLYKQISGLHEAARNCFCAIKIEGHFTQIKYRVIPGQSRPGETLLELQERQLIQTFSHQSGTLFGFMSPGYTAGLSVPGIHLHFLSKDRQHGGHVLDFETNSQPATLSTAVIRKYNLEIPDTKEFGTKCVIVHDKVDLDRAEGMHHS
ncbi:hypothetical protein ASPZODRAFT_2122789 [Penicilliopsis zonata CBS 506.65]|uniref:Alpha-acetolactate decarboxylase n=1 Tax=Penicilliopsis zonata CBS 506.65 TaxID=1073090 RepID=A0A1L9S4P5_9EURO|nr:hypothetical protein ASPZODRAFT_2122789 [Penicilliopsis zonata CBS 506.65]OJJ42135.1 hypothetical protein ASPZODRAFT_2122789 [Penicilliopsis zonata CBS 506.65]